ncbi:hypothetical protein GQ53DRAFT_717713 [Thozetella sp. PMI_491]|nr:hypothetical protein GQ53DRAFT_717713 [Thozetella sp. PMI_491]
MAPNVAFITGANGITGSAILEHLVHNTTSAEWSTIVVTTRSSLAATVNDKRVKFISLDFTNDPSELIAAMRPLCGDVTHAYFSSYVHKDDFGELNESNRTIFQNFLDSLLAVSPKLECCLLQTGGKHYNVHLGPVPSPAREEEPRRECPIGNFYYPQEDYLIEKQGGQSWRWNVIRPVAIIGYTATANGMNEAVTLALYFLVCRELGVEAIMPTNQIYWGGYEDISDYRLVADISVWASTHPHAGNQAFNISNGDHFSWRYMWPRLATYFGAEATSAQAFAKPRPKEGEKQQEISFLEWSRDKRGAWERLCDKAGCQGAKSTWDAGTWAFQDWAFGRTWSATLSINKARELGWTGHIDSYKSFIHAFERFAEEGKIPRPEALVK